jgi:large subunit ribosomal protein L15
MDLSTVHQGVHKLKLKKRVARGVGSGHGKTGARGHKGQYSSAGGKRPISLFEGGQMQLFRRIPKRGFNNATWARTFLVVNVGDLNVFEDGAVVDRAALKSKGLANGPADGVRILGNGELSKKLTVKADHFTKSALEKITGKGGAVEVVPPPAKPVRNKMKPRKPKS